MDHEGQTSLQRQVSRNEFQKGRPWEYSFKAYLKPTIHDKLTSIDVEVSYELASSGGGRGKNSFSKSINCGSIKYYYLIDYIIPLNNLH